MPLDRRSYTLGNTEIIQVQGVTLPSPLGASSTLLAPPSPSQSQLQFVSERQQLLSMTSSSDGFNLPSVGAAGGGRGRAPVPVTVFKHVLPRAVRNTTDGLMRFNQFKIIRCTLYLRLYWR